MGNPLVFLVCFVLVHHVSSLQWYPQSLQDHDTVFACVGKDLALPWNVTLGPGEQIVDIQWYFHGHSDEMIAFSSHGLFVPLPAFSGGRVDFSANAGIVLHHVTSADMGLYSVEINGRGADGTSFTLNRTVTVIVSGNLLTSDGAVHIQLNETAVHDKADDDFHVILTCGHFTHSTVPPFDVEWQTPKGQNVSSTSYSDGQFYLELDNPVDGGQYTCRVPLTSAQHSCVHNDVESTLTVDKVDVRLTLLEAENNHLKAMHAHDISHLQSLHTQDISHLQSLHTQDISHLQSLQTQTQNQLNNYISETSRHVSFHVKDLAGLVYGSVGDTVNFNETPSNNQGNAYNTGSSQFRAPYRGTYMFLVTTTAITSSYYGNVEIVVDGTEACKINSQIPGNVASCQTIVDLNVGQLVWVRSLSPIYIYEETAFSGFLLNSHS